MCRSTTTTTFLAPTPISLTAVTMATSPPLLPIPPMIASTTTATLPIKMKKKLYYDEWELSTPRTISREPSLASIDEENEMLLFNDDNNNKWDHQTTTFLGYSDDESSSDDDDSTDGDENDYLFVSPQQLPSPPPPMPRMQLPAKSPLPSCMKKMTTKTQEGPQPQRERKQVHFGFVSIRAHDVTLGSHAVPTRGGIPLGLDWTYVQQPTLDLEDYEDMKFTRGGKFHLSKQKRLDILKLAGYDGLALRQARSLVKTTKRQRILSNLLHPAETVLQKLSPWLRHC